MLERVAFEHLEAWGGGDHSSALEVFRRSSREILTRGSEFSHPPRFGGSRSSWLHTCRAAGEAADARQFFESRFRAFRVRDPERPQGLFTGYFEPEVEGSREATSTFCVPIYRHPPDLVAFAPDLRARSGLAFGRMIGERACPYRTRKEIENGALAGLGLEIVHLRDWADAFFIHVQGSARVRLEDGSTLRLTFDGKSGLPYTSIGTLLVERGVLRGDEVSMGTIRRWMAAYPREARHLMWENESFIFFREALLDDSRLGAFGAQQVQLTPRRSLAVDRSVWMLGTPVWLDMKVPSGEEGNMTSMTPFRQLLVAQDTGSAIKGLARGDVFWGFGESAGRIAGPMKSPGSMTVLLPHAVADELGLG